MDGDSIMILKKIIIDFIILFVVGMGVLMFYLFGQPFERGLFCGDQSISYPFGESTITNPVLYVVGLFLPICIIMFSEYKHTKNHRGQSARVFMGYTIPPWVCMAYYHIGIFGFGAASTVLTTDIAKYTIGRLRPHFMTVCNPTACSLANSTGTYVANIVCDPPAQFSGRALKEARLSFPSGHSSFSAYTMIYLILYLQLRMQWNGSKLLKHFIQMICFFMAWFTALSRISNYKHHWSDVLAGSTLGVIIALVVANCVADLFKSDKTEIKSDNFRDTDYETEGTQGETRPLRNSAPRYDAVPVD